MKVDIVMRYVGLPHKQLQGPVEEVLKTDEEWRPEQLCRECEEKHVSP